MGGKDISSLEIKDTITIALRDEKRPLMYMEKEKAKGVYPEIFSELGNISGLNVKYKTFNENVSYKEMMEDKDVDFVIVDYYTLSPDEKKNCTNNILEGSYMTVIRENENMNIDKEVIVALMEYQRNNEKNFKKAWPNSKFIYYKDLMMSLKAVSNGVADIGIVTEIRGRYMLQSPYLNNLVLTTLVD